MADVHPIEASRRSGELRFRQTHLDEKKPQQGGGNQRDFNAVDSSIQNRLSNMIPQPLRSSFGKVPKIYLYTLASDVLYWLVVGGIMLLFPQTALELHRRLSNSMKIAGPSPSVASNTLLVYVQTCGAILASLSVLPLYGWFTRNVAFAQSYALFRTLIGFCLLSIIFTHPLQSSFKILWPFVLHSFWHAGALLSSRDTLRPLLKSIGIGKDAEAAAATGLRAS
jgi:hypothetical protein